MTQVGALNVSRETFDQLETLDALVRKWTPRINLISKSDLDVLWHRHIVDSAQVFQHGGEANQWIDLGSGGGFPALVVAVLSKSTYPNRTFTLVESDQRKCAFLRTAARELELPVSVVSERIEDVEPLNAEIMSARALADLATLLGFAERHMAPGGHALFPKGESWEKEHQAAQRLWSYTIEPIKSATNPAAAVLKIQDIARV